MKSNVKTINRPILAYAAAMWLACGLVASNAHAGDEARSETVKSTMSRWPLGFC